MPLTIRTRLSRIWEMLQRHHDRQVGHRLGTGLLPLPPGYVLSPNVDHSGRVLSIDIVSEDCTCLVCTEVRQAKGGV